ncbi:MAG: hypothetical protein U0V54_14055 [Saprospiraceae bacterium]|nr:hypothetical protein [Saprospiraceae bacterium]
MNINILKEKNEILLNEVARWIHLAETQNFECNALCEQFLQACCEVHVSYKMACRASSRATFMDGLRQVVSAAIRLHYWIHCMEAYRPNSSGELYSIKREADEIQALCIASIKTMEKKEKPH